MPRSETLKEKIQADIKKAMIGKEALRVSVLRMLMAVILNKEKEKKAELNDEETLELALSEAKKRKDSIEQYQKGNRQDLVDQEKEELGILNEYLPEQIPEDEIRKIVKEKIEEIGASGPQDTGKVMGQLMSQFKGKADGGLVNKIVQEELKNN